jgi:site-specific DNA recombinase
MTRQQAMRSTRTRPAVPVRAAIYARVSSDQQAERRTIDSQVQDLLARAAADGREVGEAFRFLDDGHSGASLVRPALERLRDLVGMAAVDLVYVHAPDRLARSYAHQAVLVEEFARAGTEVVFLNRPIGRSPEDDLLLQLQGMFAEYERARMLERSRRGKRHLARAGVVSVLTRAPYGYRYVGRDAGNGVARFEVVEDKAEVVRRIFRWVGVERVTLAAVCRRLAEAGVPSPTGNARWSRSMIGTLLSNSAYAGRAVFGKNASVPWRPPLRPARGRAGVPKRPSRQVPAPPERWITIPVPAIIDEGLFESAREQLAENRRRNRQRLAGVRYLLQGLLVCHKCGYAFCGRWQPLYPREAGRGYHYYRCCGTESNRFDGRRRCDARVVAVAPLDAAVWAEVRRLLEDPARVLSEHRRRLEAARAGPRRLAGEAVERRLASLRRGIGRLIDGYAEGLIDKAELEPRLAALRRRVAELESEAAALRDAADETRSLRLVIGKLETFAGMVGDRLEAADWDTKRDIIRTLVRRVEIDDDHVRVVFRVDPGPNDNGRSPRLLQHCPGREQELPSEGHDRDPADPPPSRPDPFPEPGAQGGVRLVAEPEPGELDHGVAQASVARLGDALLALGPTALPRARRQARVGRDLPPVIEAAEQRLEPEQRAELAADALEARERRGRRPGSGSLGRRLDQRITLALDRGDLRGDQLDPLEFPPDLGLEPLGQGTSVTGLERVETGQTILAERIVVDDPPPVEQPLDPVRVLDALLEQRGALARQAPAVLLFRARRPHHRAHAPLAARPSHEAAQEHLTVDRVRLGPAMPPVDGDRGGIDDTARDPVPLQQAVQPETVEPGLSDDQDLDRPTGPPLGRRPQPRQEVEESSAIAARDGMPRQLIAAGRVHGHEPPRLPQLERREEPACVRPGRGFDRGRARIRHHRLPPSWAWQPRSNGSGRGPPP